MFPFYNCTSYILPYPCNDSSNCYPYIKELEKGRYFIELYGASGGDYLNKSTSRRNPDNSGCLSDTFIRNYNGNTDCNAKSSLAGAGGYSAGILTLNEKTDVFIHIGGAGQYFAPNSFMYTGAASDLSQNRPKGGYNGGGRGTGYKLSSSNYGSGGGGGATDLRIGSDDLFHRVLVAGGGGGADNQRGDYGGDDDGSGGAGGGESAQGFWIAGVYYGGLVSNQTFGFSFGQGEAARSGYSNHPFGRKNYINGALSDRSGAGGGWFGGFCSHDGNGGSGGGSGFALTSSSVLPLGNLNVYNDLYEFVETGSYAFNTDSSYCLTSTTIIQGIWRGNGMARVTLLDTCLKNTQASQNWMHSRDIIPLIPLILNSFIILIID